jgi:P4 family phage/plasmid primase-like protien
MSTAIHDQKSRITRMDVVKGVNPQLTSKQPTIDRRLVTPYKPEVVPAKDLFLNDSTNVYTTLTDNKIDTSVNNNASADVFIEQWGKLQPISYYNNESSIKAQQYIASQKQLQSNSININDLIIQTVPPRIPIKLFETRSQAINEDIETFNSTNKYINGENPTNPIQSSNVNIENKSHYVHSSENLISQGDKVANSGSMEPGLSTLLHFLSVNSHNSYTHITLYDPHARWTVPQHNYTMFWIGYCDLIDHVNNGYDGIPANSLANICLAERPQDNQPLITQLTFKFNINGRNDILGEVYDTVFLQWICHIYQTVIMEYFNVNMSNKLELNVVILESTDCDYYYNRERNQHFMELNIRMQFPYARIDVGMQNRLVRPRVIQLLRHNNILAKMRRQPIGEWELIISSDIANEPVVMYGSNTTAGQPKLELTHIWPYITTEILDQCMEPNEIALEDAFVPQNHNHVHQKLVDPSIFDNHELNYWLPMFLSLEYWPTILKAKTEVNDGGRFTTQLRLIRVPQEPITEPSINPAIVRHRDQGMILLEKALSGYHTDIANAILFYCFKPIEIMDIPDCYSIIYDTDTSEIYLWNLEQLLWKPHDHLIQGSHPKIRAFDDIIGRYTDIRSLFIKQIKESDNDSFKNESDLKIKKITSLIGKLKTRQYKESVWKEVLEQVEIKFSTYCDKVSANLPLNNGTLFNIFTYESRLRTPKDFYTFTINAHITDTVTSIKPNEGSSEDHKFAWKFFYDLMSHDEEKTLFLIKRLAIFISGNLLDQSYMIWIGDSNNGKSLLLKFLRWLLGDSCGPAAEGVFLDSGAKQPANAHTSHLCALKGLRIAYLSETKPGGVISSANIKAITGGDDIKTRAAYDRISNNFQAFCHLILATQHLPIMNTNDEGMLKRTLVINFRTWFRPRDCTFYNPNSILTIDEDRTMESKLKTNGVANAILTMMSLAAHEYYINNYTCTIPQEIKTSLSTYAEASFPYSDFISEVCILDPGRYINSARMHEFYQAYCNGRGDSNKTFVNKMTKKFTRQRRGHDSGYCYIGIDIDISRLQNIIRNRQAFTRTLQLHVIKPEPIIVGVPITPNYNIES